MITQTAAPKYEKVMVIDDTYVDRYISIRVISRQGFGKEVLQFETGNEALKYLEENATRPDALPGVIFVDIYMPGMTGFEFMERYNMLDPSVKNHCKVFMISSTFDKGDISRARSFDHVVDFIEKPLSVETLAKL